MSKVIFKMPISIAVEFAGWQFTDADVGRFATTGLFAPGDADLGGQLSDVFEIFGIGPKFDLSSWLGF